LGQNFNLQSTFGLVALVTACRSVETSASSDISTNLIMRKIAYSHIEHISWNYYYYYLFISSVNIKPTRHRFGFSLAWDWQYRNPERYEALK
jgi:hypothetical protein